MKTLIKKVRLLFPNATICVRHDVDSYTTAPKETKTTYSLYCSAFSEDIVVYSWSPSFRTLAGLTKWYETTTNKQ